MRKKHYIYFFLSNKMNPYIIVNGQSSLPDKINTVNQISNATARQQWKTVFTKNRNLVSRLDTLVILNNRNASITFRFNVSAGNYDIYLRCIAPTSKTDTSIIRMDSTKPKILDLKRRPQQSISQQVNVLLFSNIVLNGSHSLTVAYKEPIGLIRLTLRKKRSTLQIVIPAVDMLYKPEQAPIIQPAPVVAYEATTQGPIIEAEYKPVEVATTTEGPMVEPPYEATTTPGPSYETTTTTSEGPQVVVPPYETTTSSEAPIVPPPLEIETSTRAAQSSTSSVQEKKKKKKGFPWWAILLIVLALLVVVIYLIYRWRKRSAVSYQDQSDQQILLDFTDKTLLLKWVNKTLQDSTLQLPFSERKELQTLKGALQSKSRNVEQQALIKWMLKCRHSQALLLKWLQKRINDPTLSPTDRNQYSALIQGLNKKPDQRSDQMKKNINTLLDCKDTNVQKQQKLLAFVEKNLAKQGLTTAERNQYTALRQALNKLPGQRSQQQKQWVSFAIQCAQQGKPIVPTTQQQQKTRDQAQAGTTAGPVPQQKIPSLTDFSFLRTRYKPDQQQQKQNSAPIEPSVKTQFIPQTISSSLTNKFLQINDKYNLNLIDEFGADDLGSQLFTIAQKDNAIKQYLQKFDPTTKQSQEQFPNIKTKLNQIFPQKKDDILIQKILKQSLNKQKRQTDAVQGAPSQKKADATRQKLQIQRRADPNVIKPKQPQTTTQGGQYQRLIKLRKPAQDGHIQNIRQGLKAVNKPKVKLTPDVQSSAPDAYQRQFAL